MSIEQFTDSLPMRLYAALDVVMPRFRRIFKDVGITEQQWRVLRVLWEVESISQSALANLCRIPPPSLVGVLDRLQNMQMIERQRSAEDRRVMHVSATRKGRELRDVVIPAVQQSYFELKASVDDETWRSLLRGLDALIKSSR